MWARTRNLPVFALEIGERATPIHEFRFPESAIMLVGNEAVGLPEEALSNSDAQVMIVQTGLVGSLNAGVAVSIALHEWAKQWADPRPIGGAKFLGEHTSTQFKTKS